MIGFAIAVGHRIVGSWAFYDQHFLPVKHELPENLTCFTRPGRFGLR